MAFIRPYRESDFDACGQICRATLPTSLSTNPLTSKLSPYLWLHQFTHLSPSTSFVLDDGTGTPQGYCVGTPDVWSFSSQYPSYITSVLSPICAQPQNLTTREPWTLLSDGMAYGHQDVVSPVALAQCAYKVEWLLDLLEDDDPDYSSPGGKRKDLPQKWHATMHINLLPPFQHQRWGSQLIAAFLESVRTSGADFGAGVHIGVAGENAKVVPFYEKQGFQVYRKPGSEGQGEGAGAVIHMTRNIDKS